MRTPTSTSRTVRLTALLAAPLTVGLVLGGCSTAPAAVPPAAAASDSASAEPAGTESVGRVTGGPADARFDGLVGLVSNGTDVVAYVCDGDTGVGERFAGTLDPAGRAELRSAGGAVLALTVAGTGAEGTFTPTGEDTPIAFTTTAASGDAGVYLADGETDGIRWGAGWIVLADGTQEGAAQENGERRKAPSLRKGKPTPAPTTVAPTTARSIPDRGELLLREPALRETKRLGTGDLTREQICRLVPTSCTR